MFDDKGNGLMSFVHRALLLSTLSTPLSFVASQIASDSDKPCALGSFPCNNSLSQFGQMCVEQKYWCDGVEHCVNGADEIAERCKFWNGGLARFRQSLWETQNRTSTNTIKKPINNEMDCDISSFPPQCQCRFRTHLKCFGWREVPTTFHGHYVTKLLLQNNSIESIKTGTFQEYTSVRSIYMDHNVVEDIEPGAFNRTQSLILLSLNSNRLHTIKRGAFYGATALVSLLLNNNFLHSFEPGAFEGPANLEYLIMNENRLRLDDNVTLTSLPTTLRWLSLGRNLIEEIKDETFSRLSSLEVLSLHGNLIFSVSGGSFHAMPNLRELDLSLNRIRQLDGNVFQFSTLLETLHMELNPLESLAFLKTFAQSNELLELNLEGVTVSMDQNPKELFAGLTKLSSICFKSFDYCQYVPHVINCSPKTDGISSVYNLLELRVLRIIIWPVAFVTCTGNVLVFVGRFVVMGVAENAPHSLLIKNLAGADFVMGIYLLTIAAHDVAYRDVYNVHAFDWMRSWGCHVTGVLAMISSEVSIFILTFVSLERYLAIVYPYSTRRLTQRGAAVSLVSLWTAGAALALLPLLSEVTFGRFYGTNGVCFPLHLRDPYEIGWQYSAFVFLGVNFTSVLIIAFCYTGMLVSVISSRRANSMASSVRSVRSRDGRSGHVTESISNTVPWKELRFVRRFFAVILTNACCWFPVVAIKLMAFSNLQLTDDAYAWVAIFILPINSALNPLLYTLSTFSFRTGLDRLRHAPFKLTRLLRRASRRASNTSQKSSSTMATTSLNPTTLAATLVACPLLQTASSRILRIEKSDFVEVHHCITMVESPTVKDELPKLIEPTLVSYNCSDL